jgi:hypothetical protein
MNTALMIEEQLVKALKAVGFKYVFNHIPEEVEYPLIHIEEIRSKPWLIKPKAYLFLVKLCVYSLGKSNKESFELGEKVCGALNGMKARVEIEEGFVHELKSDIWCNEIFLKIWQIEGGDYE